MRIAVLTGIYPPDIGGPATYVPLLLKELGRRHEIVGVVTLADRRRLPPPFPRDPYPVTRIERALPKMIRVPLTVLQIARLAKNADVVFLAGMVLEGTLATRFLCRRATVVRVGGDLIWERAFAQGVSRGSIAEFQRQPLPLKWRALRKLQSAYTRSADVVITPSADLARVLCQDWDVPAGRVRVIRNGVPYEAETRRATPAQYDVVTVCRLLPLKGLEALLRCAVARRWRLAIVGEGPLGVSLAAMLPPSSSVRLLGRMDPAGVVRVLHSSAVFVLNSVGEGLSNSLLEAKRSGLPSVATDVGGNSEIVRDGIDGFLIRPGDDEALVAKVEELLSQPDMRERFALQARKDAEERFSIRAMAALTEAALSDAISMRRARGEQSG